MEIGSCVLSAPLHIMPCGGQRSQAGGWPYRDAGVVVFGAPHIAGPRVLLILANLIQTLRHRICTRTIATALLARGSHDEKAMCLRDDALLSTRQLFLALFRRRSRSARGTLELRRRRAGQRSIITHFTSGV
jgi:hypothetical protein